MKAQAMKQAWTTRKEAAAKFNCKVAEISMSLCLIMAWAQIKGKKVETKLTHTWNLKDGRKATATSELTLKETVYADGYNVEVDCCKRSFSLEIEGMGIIGTYLSRRPVEVNGVTHPATCGKCAFSPETFAAIDAMESKLDQHPAWIAKQEKITKNQKEIAKMEAKRTANGYCHKCGSYCYGDCEA